MDIHLFPMSEYWWAYAGFIVLVLALLLIDLGVFHRKAHAVSLREATTWSVVWITLALLFGFGLYQFSLWKFSGDARLLAYPGFNPVLAAKQVGLEYLTGYVVEKSLAVDNLFVFVVVFNYFHVPNKYQHRVLFYGIIGALILRGIFIALGAFLMQYHWVVYLFGAFLIVTGLKLIFGPDKAPDPAKNPVVRLTRKLFPVTPELHGEKFFVKKNHVLYATPLFLALIFLEVTDIVFAVDSVPAIFAITKEPFIVFTSNIFAILGLRSMYFLLAGVMDIFRFLKYGLGIILAFVGLKMVWLNDLYDGKFPISWSLGFIGGVLLLTILLSLIIRKKEA